MIIVPKIEELGHTPYSAEEHLKAVTSLGFKQVEPMAFKLTRDCTDSFVFLNLDPRSRKFAEDAYSIHQQKNGDVRLAHSIHEADAVVTSSLQRYYDNDAYFGTAEQDIPQIRGVTTLFIAPDFELKPLRFHVDVKKKISGNVEQFVERGADFVDMIIRQRGRVKWAGINSGGASGCGFLEHYQRGRIGLYALTGTDAADFLRRYGITRKPRD